MINKVYDTIREYNLINEGEKIVIGLSGGADSVCLTHVLWRLKDMLGISLHAVHMNHGIRGEEADSDEASAKLFSDSLCIPFTSKSENVPEYAKKRGISEELAGRELRYAFFDEIIREKGFDKIATAHNRNDNAETILMNFMRGSGLKGLGGIPYMRGNIIRPILDITRDEIEQYCAENNLNYVTDSTNKEKIYTRNKIRLELIPEIQNTFNPNFINTVTENAKLLSSDGLYLDKKAKDFYSENCRDGKIVISALLEQSVPIRNRVIIEMLSNACGGNTHDFSARYIKDILKLTYKGKSGTYINLPNNICAAVEYGKLYIGRRKQTGEFEYEIPVGGSVYVKELDKTFCAEYTDKISDKGIYIFADKNDKITIRNRRNGDFFYPEGMNGRKKIKDFFIDSKIPREERATAAIITVNGEIAYIVGKRYDKRFKFKEKGIKITLI